MMRAYYNVLSGKTHHLEEFSKYLDDENANFQKERQVKGFASVQKVGHIEDFSKYLDQQDAKHEEQRKVKEITSDKIHHLEDFSTQFDAGRKVFSKLLNYSKVPPACHQFQ